MSKKLIAVASAAALALSALVAAPASAAAFSVTLEGDFGAGGNIGLTAATAAEVNLPTQDVLRFDTDDATTTGTAVRVTVTTTDDDKTVNVTTTGGVKVLTAAQWASTSVTKNSKAGATSVSAATSAGTDQAIFYIFTTSNAAGTAVFSQDGNSRTVHLKGIHEVAYNLNFSTDATADLDGDITITGNVTDAFGNKITGITAPGTRLSAIFTDPLTVQAFGGAGTTINEWEEAEDADGAGTGTYTFTVTAGDTAGAKIVGLTVAATTKVTAFGTPKSTQYFTVNVSSLAEQVTALQAQVTALQAIVDRKVTKKRYNTLARKWNAAFTSQKVWVKP